MCFKQEEKGKTSSCFLNEIQLLSLSYDFTRAGYDNIHFLIAGPLHCIAILKLKFESQHLFDRFPVPLGGGRSPLYIFRCLRFLLPQQSCQSLLPQTC